MDSHSCFTCRLAGHGPVQARYGGAGKNAKIVKKIYSSHVYLACVRALLPCCGPIIYKRRPMYGWHLGTAGACVGIYTFVVWCNGSNAVLAEASRKFYEVDVSRTQTPSTAAPMCNRRLSRTATRSSARDHQRVRASTAHPSHPTFSSTMQPFTSTNATCSPVCAAWLNGDAAIAPHS